jgi:hypothetical protein
LPAITPVVQDQRPVSLMPPSAGRPRPVAASGAGARNGRVAKALVLRLLAEQRNHPDVQSVEADRPSAGRASVGHSAHRIEDRGKVCLATAVARRNQ